jgi:hypothetical protein
LPESSDRAASITIEEAFAYCRAHPVAGIDVERFLGIFVTDAHRIVDARDFGLVGVIRPSSNASSGRRASWGFRRST